MWAIMNLLYYIVMLVVMVKLVSNMIKGLVVSPPPTPSTTPSKPKQSGGGGSTPSTQPKSQPKSGGGSRGGGGGLPPGHRYLVPLRVLVFRPEEVMGRVGGMYHVFAKVVCPDNTIASAWLWMNYPDPKRIRCICNRSPWGLVCIGNELEVV